MISAQTRRVLADGTVRFNSYSFLCHGAHPGELVEIVSDPATQAAVRWQYPSRRKARKNISALPDPARNQPRTGHAASSSTHSGSGKTSCNPAGQARHDAVLPVLRNIRSARIRAATQAESRHTTYLPIPSASSAPSAFGARKTGKRK